MNTCEKPGGEGVAGPLVLFQHHFGGLDHCGHRIANLELHLLGAPLRDHALDQILAHVYDHMGHNAAELDFDDFAFESITRGECHQRSIRPRSERIHTSRENRSISPSAYSD